MCAAASPIRSVATLPQLNLHAAGLDIGASEIWACVPEGCAVRAVRGFAPFTADLHALADWLQACGVDPGAMESTGVFWIPVFEILEARGLRVYLVHARYIKKVPGKKTDVLDCQWIQQLHTYGLLHAAFRPDAEMAALRAYIRHRDTLMRYRSAHIQHMQKALHLMNIRLSQVLSDITGVTGLTIIRALLAGEHDPVQLAQYRNPRCARSEAEIAQALTGHYRDEHLFALRHAVERYDFYTAQIQACDAEIERKYTAFKPLVDLELQPLAPAQRRKRRPGNAPAFDLRTALYQVSGVDLTRIDGIDALTAQTVLSEIGLDMDRWPTVKHFTSWLGLAPHNAISGGKVLSRGTPKTSNRANTALRMAAQAVSRSQSAIGALYRRMRAKHGSAKANVATVHKLARLIYYLLKTRQQYVDPGQELYEARYRARALERLKRRAAKLGAQVVMPQPQAVNVS
jgi:transposase